MTSLHDLLRDPILSWRGSDRIRRYATLPGLIEKVSTGEVADFPNLRAHQFHPWSMFLTQLAAIALKRGGGRDVSDLDSVSEAGWFDRLLSLTSGAREPWCLVVGELRQPAFFQPPVPEGSIKGWKQAENPDDIDVLVTSKQHDVKTSLISGAEIEGWIYALATLQTTQGYPGRGYNGVARMKGGYGSRARVGISPDHTLAARFRRDVGVLLRTWPSLVERGYADDGLSLAWTSTWDGKESLGTGVLSPHFVEVCWRLRLVSRTRGVGLSCSYTTTQKRRCLPDIHNGDVGDPWIPIERSGGALTVGNSGFQYRLLSEVLFGGSYAPAPAQELVAGDGAAVFMSFAVLVRGQGKTGGLHERQLLLSGKARRLLGEPDGRLLLETRATRWIQDAEKMRRKVLFPALKKIALGETVVPGGFDHRVDEIFYDQLFESLEQSAEEAQRMWETRLKSIAWQELQVAISRATDSAARHYRSIVEAEGMFFGCFKKQFADLAAFESAARDRDEREARRPNGCDAGMAMGHDDSREEDTQ